MKTFAIVLAAVAVVEGPAFAQTNSLRQASIDDAANGGIRDWHADNAEGIYLRDRTNRWYFASFSHQCPGVLLEGTISFNTFGDNRFDRNSRVVTRVGSCALDSLIRSPAPVAKGGRASLEPY